MAVMLNRRAFVLGSFGAAAGSALAQAEWGGPVLDLHHHPRRDVTLDLAHMDGAGVTHALYLGQAGAADRLKANVEKHPQRLRWFVSANVAGPEGIDALRKAAEAGAGGFGELKSQVAADGPEMRRVYAMAAEFRIPVLLHFQEVSQPASPGTFNTGLARLPAILKEFRSTIFIGHADFFWANISAEVPTDTAYPTGPIKGGGITDRLLSDYPNLYGDLSANSGRNALARDDEFIAGFLKRHQDKLMFGSDCSCQDGRGGGQRSQAPLIKGRCVARETLTALRKLAPPDVFRKMVWTNGSKLLKINV
jgi:predicted TIM-barrel fold metal-dependent hydrolase